MRGLYLNTPPKPKQAKVEELQEAEELEHEVDGSLEEETERKNRKGVQRTGGCNEEDARSGELEELHGAHGGSKLDQEGRPRSLNSIARAHKVAQVAIIAIGSRVWRTSM